MTYHIAVCDDEAEQAERLRSIAEAWAEKCGVTCRTDCFPSAEALLFAYADDADFDILLLDVEMKEMSGIRLAKRLRADGCKAEIAFITSHFEFVTEGYEVDALHYLVKPVAAEKLCEVLTRAAERLAVEPPSVVISCEGASRKLYESEIRGILPARPCDPHKDAGIPRQGEHFRLCRTAQRGLFPRPPLLSGQSEGGAPHQPKLRHAGGRRGDSVGPRKIRRDPQGLYRTELR